MLKIQKVIICLITAIVVCIFQQLFHDFLTLFIFVWAASFDDINADEEIKEVLEDDSVELDKSVTGTEEDQITTGVDEKKEEDKYVTKESDKQTLTAQKNNESSNDDNKEKIETEEIKSSVDNKPEIEKEDNSKDSASKKLLRMQLSTQTLQKLLKEGRMERLPTGSFRMSADALKELKKEKEAQDQQSPSPKKFSQKRKVSEAENSSDNYDEDMEIGEEEELDLTPTPKMKHVSKKTVTSVKRAYDEKATSEQNTPVKKPENDEPIRKKKRIFHDYVSDFNSSEDEDDELIASLQNSLAELAPKKPGHLTKPVKLLFEQLHKTMFGEMSDDSHDEFDELEGDDKSHEDRIRQLALSDPDFGKNGSSGNINDIPSDFWMVGRIGNNCKTKMCIRSTGKTKTFEGSQYPVYNIDTGVGSVTTVTPLMVTALKAEPLEHDKVSN